MRNKKAALALALALVVGALAVLPAASPAAASVLEQAYRRLGQVFIVTSVSGAALDVDQRGAGSIANFSDGGSDEYTFDQSSATFANPLTLQSTLSIGGATTLSGGVTQAVGTSLENVGMLPTLQSAAVITSSAGALWTVGSGEVWNVHRVFCKITTNFDCSGDDCALIIGDGNDTDGFLVLADAELQTADTEGTGFAAGWQGLVSATVGAYLDAQGSFIYAAADTIDVDIRDASAGTNPTAGAGTCYIDYTRLQ